MSSSSSPSMTFLEIEQLKFAEVSRRQYRYHKNKLEPLVFTHWGEVCTNLRDYMANDAELLCSKADRTPAECSVHQGEGAGQTMYFVPDDSEEDKTAEHNNNNNISGSSASGSAASAGGADPATAKSSSRMKKVFLPQGGIDILDDPKTLEAELLSLHVSALQDQVAQQGNSSPSSAVMAEFRNSSSHNSLYSLPTSPNVRFDGSKKAVCGFTLGDARDVLVNRTRRSAAEHKDAASASLFTPFEELESSAGHLYMKSLISGNAELMGQLALEHFFFVPPDPYAVSATGHPRLNDVYYPLHHPLLLVPHSYVAWVMLAEQGATTRAHVNVMGAHGYHILQKGQKKWRIVHPLDRHLITDLKTGEPMNLFEMDFVQCPHAAHARIYEYVQNEGEAVFLPSDAFYSERSLSATTAVAIAFMDNSCTAMFEKQKRNHAIIAKKGKVDLMDAELTPLTTVDVVMFTGSGSDDDAACGCPSTSELAAERQDVYILRSLTEFTQVKYPINELGARIELEALQQCFGTLGDALLTREEKHYVVGMPKGYLLSRGDRRLLLYYRIKPHSLSIIRKCLEECKKKLRNYIHWYRGEKVTLPAVVPFHHTCSHQGRIPSFIPLSVLFGQSWPFEADLCGSLVSLGRVILDKAYQPLGFIRPAAVWHYSRFLTAKGAPSDTYEDERAADSISLPTSSPSAEVRLERHLEHGWCRTFLFYCSPSLEKPVSMHPVRAHFNLQAKKEVNAVPDDSFLHPLRPDEENGTDGAGFVPRVLEFAWDVDMLESYGMVSLIQLAKKYETRRVIEAKIISSPSFSAFVSFVKDHMMNGSVALTEDSGEKIMGSVLYFLCAPSVVGYVSGTSSGAVGNEDTSLALEPLQHCFKNTSFTRDQVDSAAAAAEWDTVCLTASAASALLRYEPHSYIANIVTRLCNWLCDQEDHPIVASRAAKDGLFGEVKRILNGTDVEQKVAVLEVIKIKRQNLHVRQNGLFPPHFPHSFDTINAEKVEELERFTSQLMSDG